ncbi:hypothetical protein [Vibrio phage CKB-S1]|nr:hypothetical protein [Vibrio phage CKB-S1]
MTPLNKNERKVLACLKSSSSSRSWPSLCRATGVRPLHLGAIVVNLEARGLILSVNRGVICSAFKYFPHKPSGAHALKVAMIRELEEFLSDV